MRADAVTVMLWALTAVVVVGALGACWLIFVNIWNAVDVSRFESLAEKDNIRKKYRYELDKVTPEPNPLRSLR